MRVAVIGAGISGLSTALELRSRGADVTVLEGSEHAGGVITTVRRDGFLIEAGPTSLTATAQLEALITRLGLDAQRIGADPAAHRRYIVRDGAPVALPTGPLSLVTTGALSGGAKLRILREPFVRAATGTDDESVADLVRRRFGDEVLTYLVNPAVAGIYAGEPARLSARHAMPMLYDAERKHGSLLRGATRELRARRGTVRQRGITSFRDGLGALTEAMARTLGSDLHCGTWVTGLTRDERPDTSGKNAWRVHLAGRAGTLAADAVVYAGPAHGIGALALPPSLQSDAARIAALDHPPLSTLALGFRHGEVAHPLDGFGMLVPAVEERDLLGVLFSSSIFAGRAPAGQVLLTCFVGGARQPDLGEAPPDTILPLVLKDLRELLGVSGAPTLVHHTCWPRAIPQYEIGHQQVLDAATRIEQALPGLHLGGQWRAGVSLGDCITHGQAIAARMTAPV